MVNVSFDWSMASYFEDVAKDGFHLLVGPILSMHLPPIGLPSGADALVTISATKNTELTRCLPNDRLPKMEFFDYYDPYGILYYYDRISLRLEAIDLLGCDTPMLTHIPPANSTWPNCPLNMPYFLKTFAAQTSEMEVYGSSSKITDFEMVSKIAPNL